MIILGGYELSELQAISGAVKAAVFRQFLVPVHSVTLLRARSLLKTSSGKLRRNDNKRLFETNGFEPTLKQEENGQKSKILFQTDAWEAKARLGLIPKSKASTGDKKTFSSKPTPLIHSSIQEDEKNRQDSSSSWYGNFTIDSNSDRSNPSHKLKKEKKKEKEVVEEEF